MLIYFCHFRDDKGLAFYEAHKKELRLEGIYSAPYQFIFWHRTSTSITYEVIVEVPEKVGIEACEYWKKNQEYAKSPRATAIPIRKGNGYYPEDEVLSICYDLSVCGEVIAFKKRYFDKYIGPKKWKINILKKYFKKVIVEEELPIYSEMKELAKNV